MKRKRTYVEIGDVTWLFGMMGASWNWPKSSSVGAWTYGVKPSSSPNKFATGAWVGTGGTICGCLFVIEALKNQ